MLVGSNGLVRLRNINDPTRFLACGDVGCFFSGMSVVLHLSTRSNTFGVGDDLSAASFQIITHPSGRMSLLAVEASGALVCGVNVRNTLILVSVQYFSLWTRTALLQACRCDNAC